MIFINTRPASRSAALSQYLMAQDIEVVQLPLLELVARELDASDDFALTQLLAGSYQVIVVVSETAVSYGLNQLALLTDKPLLNTTFVAVGEATAMLLQQGWQARFTTPCPPIITPTQAQLPENNEGMLALPTIRHLMAGDKVLLWRGVGGRELLADTLKDRGVIVDSIAFYQRQLPTVSLSLWQQLYQNKRLPTTTNTHLSACDNQPVWVLISSLTAWQYWQQLVAATPIRLDEFGYIALQSRITEHIKACGIVKLQVIDNLQPTSIHQALLSTL